MAKIKTQEEFFRDNLVLERMISKELWEEYLNTPHAKRSSLIYDQLVKVLKVNPNLELWLPHYEANKKGLSTDEGMFFEAPGVYVSNRGNVYNIHTGNLSRGKSRYRSKTLRYQYRIGEQRFFVNVRRAVASMFVPCHLDVSMDMCVPTDLDGCRQNNDFRNLRWMISDFFSADVLV